MSAYHLSRDKKIAGVCAGLAETWDVDPVKVRIVTVVIALLGVSTPLAIILYLALWWLLPEQDSVDRN